jgi:hypothetical protein
MTYDSSLLVHQLSGGEHSEVWNSPYVESGSQLLMSVGVDLQDNGVTRHVGGCSRDLRSRGPARPAPFSPEVDEDRNLGAPDDLVEELLAYLKWFVDWGQSRLARSTLPGVRKMPGADTIFLTALFTGSNRRHRNPPFAKSL